MTLTRPLVSVIMPCYNAADFIHAALNSILKQDYPNLEILLIDDGSADHTLAIIKEYAQKDARIKYLINENNMGLIRTLNRGIAACTGAYIARMDADDECDPERITKIINEFQRRPGVSIVSAGYYLMNLKGKLIQQCRPKAYHTQALKFVSLFSTPVVHACAVFKAEVLKENLYDERYLHSEDYEIFSRLLFLNYEAFNLDEPLYSIRINPESVSFKYEQVQVNTHTAISASNIKKYFGIILDPQIHKITVNRITFEITSGQVKKAFNEIIKLKKEFLKSNICSVYEKNEIDNFLLEQKMDILFQSYKRAANKLAILVLIILSIRIFLNRRSFNYFLSKIQSKMVFPVVLYICIGMWGSNLI